MDTSTNEPAELLMKRLNGDITPIEQALLQKLMDEIPVLQEKFEELSDPENWWKRFWYRFEIVVEPWPVFKQRMVIV